MKDTEKMTTISNNERYKHFFINDTLPSNFPKEDQYSSPQEFRKAAIQYIHSNKALIKPSYRDIIKEEEEHAEIN